MALQTLYQAFLECSSVCTDTRKIEHDSMFFCLKGPNFNANTFAAQALELGAKYVVVDDAEFKTSDKMFLVEDVLTTLQQLATYHRKQLNTPLVALTGSNGKTTTKELIHAVLSQKFNVLSTFGNLNNHIGVPLTLLRLTKKTEIGIIEMGANHQKEIAFLCQLAQPDYGYITNFGKAHLEGFGGVEGVIKGKSEIYDYLRSANKMVFVNDQDCIQVEKTAEMKQFCFGSPNSHVNIEDINSSNFLKLKVNNSWIQSNLTGIYNVSNIAAAIAIGVYFKLDLNQIKKGIEDYIPNNHRSQIMKHHDCQIILDCYNANPSSMHVAIENLEQMEATSKLAILGDMFELGDTGTIEHKVLVDKMISNGIKTIFVGKHFYQHQFNDTDYLFFEDFNQLSDAFPKIDKDTLILIKGSRAVALERVLELIK